MLSRSSVLAAVVVLLKKGVVAMIIRVRLEIKNDIIILKK